MFEYMKTEKTDFLLLNDMVLMETDLEDLIKFISHYMKCTVARTDELIELIQPMTMTYSREVIGLGDGGELLGNRMLGKGRIKKLPMYREWKNGDYNLRCDPPTEPLAIGNVQIIDDVVASGESLYTARERLDPLHSRNFSGLILVSSGNFNSTFRSPDGGVVGYDKLTSALLVLGDSGSDPYWYPAIYSMRHLLFKQERDPQYLERVANRYFNGNTNSLKMMFKPLRQALVKDIDK